MSATPPRTGFTGTRRFEVIRVLGMGGMGVVYEAFDRERQAKVALKTLLSLDSEAWLRLKSEFRSLQGLQHPNLVSLGELLEEGEHLFFTMELVRGVDFLAYVRPRVGRSLLPAPYAGSSDRPPARQSTTPPHLREDVTAAGPQSSRSLVKAPSLRHLGSTYDEARLRAAFGQLARGLHALHVAQKVHRDIKPSNVLVTDEGRVIILDFGVVADLSQPLEAVDGRRVGTAHFMAPEQAAARPVGPEADWYSAGVMLYLALAGAYPFPMAPEAAIDFKQRVEPPPPGLLVDGLPPDLESLCVDLLRRDAAARPTGREVLARLGVPLEEEPAPLLASEFVGRQGELEALHDALLASRDGAVAMLIEGESGVGKSALVRCFLEQIAGAALGFAGRCYERESVPFKAIDELVGGLARHLATLPDAEAEALLPRDVELLAVVFPALRRIPAVGRAGRPAAAIEPLEIRALAFRALRELCRRLAVRAPLILAVDDLQWADLDSIALLADVLRAPGAPPLLLVATLRSAAGPRSGASGSRWADLLFDEAPAGGRPPAEDLAQRFFLPACAVRRLPLSSLSPVEAHELAGALLHHAAREASSAPPSQRISSEPPAESSRGLGLSAAALAEESGGMPFFIDALVRHRHARGPGVGGVRLDDVLWATVQRLDEPARQVVAMVAVAGRPLLRDVAARASGIEGGELARVLVLLGAAHLIRTGGSGRDEFVEPFHDRVREAVAGRLDPEQKRAWHRRLALALEASGRADLGALAGHWCEAGEIGQAADFAARAGDQASRALAFGRAAQLYRTAIEIQPLEGEAGTALLVKLADALGNAGRGAEAAEAYLAAMYEGTADEGLELERRAVENLLRSGHVSEGLGGLRSVLERLSMEMPASPRVALGSLNRHVAELRSRGLAFVERPADEVPARRLIEIDACWSASLGLGMVEPICGADFLARGLLLSLDAGEAYRVARSLALAAAFASGSGGDPGRAQGTELIDAAEDIGLRTFHPHALGLVQGVRGVMMFGEGRYREAVRALDGAEMIFRQECAGVSWERGSVIAFAAWAFWFLGELGELGRRVPHYLREADERGDRYFAAGLRSGIANVHWLVGDDPAAARRETEEALSSWSTEGFHLQHFFGLFAAGQIDLYEGDGAAAHRRLRESWPALAASLALRVQFVRLPALHLRARASLAAAAVERAPAVRHRLLRAAERMALCLAAEATRGSSALGALVLGGVAAARGDLPLATARLEEAGRGFEAAEMALYQQASRRRAGEIAGGDAGEAAVAAADDWMREQGVRSPVRMVGMLAPGF
jgi:serine/threonine protein kinase